MGEAPDAQELNSIHLCSAFGFSAYEEAASPLQKNMPDILEDGPMDSKACAVIYSAKYVQVTS